MNTLLAEIVQCMSKENDHGNSSQTVVPPSRNSECDLLLRRLARVFVMQHCQRPQSSIDRGVVSTRSTRSRISVRSCLLPLHGGHQQRVAFAFGGNFFFFSNNENKTKITTKKNNPYLVCDRTDRVRRSSDREKKSNNETAVRSRSAVVVCVRVCVQIGSDALTIFKTI